MTTPDDAVTVPALRVKQWLPEWEQVNFDPQQNQAKPGPHFYVFSLSAARLRKKLDDTSSRVSPGQDSAMHSGRMPGTTASANLVGFQRPW